MLTEWHQWYRQRSAGTQLVVAIIATILAYLPLYNEKYILRTTTELGIDGIDKFSFGLLISITETKPIKLVPVAALVYIISVVGAMFEWKRRWHATGRLPDLVPILLAGVLLSMLVFLVIFTLILFTPLVWAGLLCLVTVTPALLPVYHVLVTIWIYLV